MKLHNLEITNIASLKGTHRVDFDSIFETSGLFAITGKTGAGKSTILNSVSLALFGQNYKKNTHNYDFVTLGETQGEIQLVFSVKNKIYRGIWRLKLRKSNGELLKKPQLARELQEKQIGAGEEEFRSLDTLPETVLELDFNQFSRTTILNQGEFAKFLSSSFTERKDILEKFYEGDKLTIVGKILKERLKSAEIKVKQKQDTVTGLGISFDDITITREEISKREDKLKVLFALSLSSQELYQNHKDISGLYIGIENNKIRLRGFELDIENNQKEHNLKRIVEDEFQKEYELFEPEYKRKTKELQIAKEKQAQRLKLQAIIQQKEQKLISIKKDQEKRVSEISLLTEKLERITSTGKKIKESNPKIDDYELKNLKADLHTSLQNDQRLNFSKKNIEVLQSKLQPLKESITTNKKTQLNLEMELKSISSAELRTQIDRLELDIQSKNKKLSQREDREKQLKEKSLGIKNYEVTTAQFAEEFKIIDQIMTKLSNNLINAQNSLKLYQLEEALGICHEASVKEGSCLICGSDLKTIKTKTANKESHSHIIEQIDELTFEHEQKKKEHDETLIKGKLLKQQLDALRSEQKSLDEEISKLDSNKSLSEEIKIANKEISECREKENLKIRSEENIRNLRKTIENEEHELKSISKQLLLEVEIVNSIQEQEVFAKKKYSLPTSHSVTTEMERLTEAKETLLNLRKDHGNLTQSLAALAKQRDAGSLEFKTIESELSIDNTDSNQLNQYFKTNKLEETDASKQLDNLEVKNEEILNKLKKTRELIKNLDISKSSLLAKRNNVVEQLKESESLIQQYIKKIKDIKFENGINIPEIDNSLNIASNIRDKISPIETNSEALKLSLDHSEEVMTTIQSYHSSFKEKLTEDHAIFTRKEKVKKQIAKIQEELKLDLNEQRSLENLNSLIGKDEFRSYILSIIEKMLIQQTNYELQRLCQGRYKIIQYQKDSRMSTEFKVRDYFHDGEVRKVSTLSGGETFLVSLAMALALAELMRGSSEIDSLFIDEGFGTLDDEAIDDAFELLQAIQFSGKQVGIISHVKSLTDRMPVNIHLNKHENKASHISIIYN